MPVPNDWSRRRLLRTAGLAGLGLAGSTLLTACGSGAAPAAPGVPGTPVRVALGWISNVEFAGFWIAAERGYYRQEGLDVTFLTGGPNAPDATATLAAGGAEIAIPVAMQAYLAAITAGNDFVAYATMFQNAPAALLSLARRPIRTAADLVGAKVLGQQGVQPYIEAAMRLAKVPTTYEFVPVGYDPGPLLAGQGDVYTCFATNQPITLERQGMVEGKDFFVTTYESLGLPQYSSFLTSKRDWVAGNRTTLVKFLRATIRGWQDNAADPAVAAKLAVDTYGADLGLDLDQQTRENELQIAFTRSDLTTSSGLMRIDPARLAGPMYTALNAAGVTGLPDPSKIIDTTLLDTVFAGRSTV